MSEKPVDMEGGVAALSLEGGGDSEESTDKGIGFFKKKTPKHKQDVEAERRGGVIPQITSANQDTDSIRYKMNPSCRRTLHIFANYFKGSIDERKGTDKDYSAIHNTFGMFGFKQHYHPDTTANEMRKLMAKFADEDYSDCDCFAVVIMTHGTDAIPSLNSEKLVLLSADHKPVYLDELIEPIKNSANLINKPKLFFVQACRGDKKDDGWKIASDGLHPGNNRFPLEADFLYAFSTPPGYVSWRDKGGSWFIQSLCKVLEETRNDHLELCQVLTRVNRMVAMEYASDPDLKKQVPSFRSTLTKELYLTPKNP